MKEVDKNNNNVNASSIEDAIRQLSKSNKEQNEVLLKIIDAFTTVPQNEHDQELVIENKNIFQIKIKKTISIIISKLKSVFRYK